MRVAPVRRACRRRTRRARSPRARRGSAPAGSGDCGARADAARAARSGSRGAGCTRARSACRPGSRSPRRAAAGRGRSGRSGGSAAPPRSSALPVRAVRVGRTQSNMSTPASITSRIPSGVADPHEVARLVGAACSAAAQSVVSNIAPRSSPIARPPIALPSKSSSAISSVERRRSSGSVPPWLIPNRSWPSARGAWRWRRAQSVVRRTASSSSPRGTPAGGTWSRHIATSLPRLRWISRRELGREARRGAVVDVAERDAVVVDGEQRVAQREDLEAAGVGQDRPVPAHEPVQPAELGDQARRRAGSGGGRSSRARSAPRAPRTSSGSSALHGRLRPDRHEHGRRHLAVRGREHAGARGAVGRGDADTSSARA